MAVQLSEHSGKAVETSMLINVPRLVTEFFAREPDPGVPSQRVAFGTSGHRGSASDNAFNEAHTLAITQVICQYRRSSGITGPLFIGIGTHALSEPALTSALEVLAGADVDVMIDAHAGYTPTPVISRAILTYNRNRDSGHADGIIITPSHNPPEDGGFKYNLPNGGSANTDVTSWIERTANDLLEVKLNGLVRVPYERALKSPRVHRHDFTGPYVGDLVNVINMDIIRSLGVKIGIDSLGGASVHFWRPIIGHYDSRTTIINEMADRTFRSTIVDWDREIRMDCSSAYAMAGLIAMRDKFGIAFANDTDADRHGVVTRSVGLMNPNHYLATAISYLFGNRPGWVAGCGIGKTIVSSGIIDRVAAQLGRTLVEVPVGFKWFVDGLINGSLGFAGEESAGVSFLRRDGSMSTTDKDGIVSGLLAAEITARTGRDPGEVFNGLTRELEIPFYERIDAPATIRQKALLKNLTPDQLGMTELAGETVCATLNAAPGDGAPIGGIKVISENGWFAARPSGTENVYKVYAESFLSREHLKRIQQEAKNALARVFGTAAF